MQQLIDPKSLARVKDLPLLARTVADGFLHGLHQSRQRGVGIEFSQYRPYGDGDELSRIDWKLFARSDRYFVREAERESDITVWFVLDTSASMAVASSTTGAANTANPVHKGWRSRIASLFAGSPKGARTAANTGRWSKLDYAVRLTAVLSNLAYRQGDRIGLAALSGNTQQVIPLGSGEQHWSNILLELARLKPSNRFPSKEMMGAVLSSVQKPGLILFISDFFDYKDETLSFVRSLAGAGSDVAAIQLESADEASFPYKGAVRFEDAETGEEVLVSAQTARETYLKARESAQTTLRDKLLKRGIELTTLSIDGPLDSALADFLKQRTRAAGA